MRKECAKLVNDLQVIVCSAAAIADGGVVGLPFKAAVGRGIRHVTANGQRKLSMNRLLEQTHVSHSQEGYLKERK